MFWHLFPWQTNDPVSWEGHLSGGLSGLIFSVIFRNEGPQKPEKVWEDESDDNEFDEQIQKDSKNNQTFTKSYEKKVSKSKTPKEKRRKINNYDELIIKLDSKTNIIEL